MFTIYQTNETFKLIFYTLGITEDMINKKQTGKIATQTILNLIESGIYLRTKEKLLQIHSKSEISLSSKEFFTFCILIDFTARCFISDIFSERLKAIHKVHPFDTSATFEEMSSFYLKYATKYFAEIKELYEDEKNVLEIIKMATDWKMNDESFK